MNDLVQKLVGALEGFMSLDRQCLRDIYGSEFLSSVDAALSEAKAGGWVAVPVEPTPEMLKAAALAPVPYDNESVYYPFEESEIGIAYVAMLAARPLPAPPAQRGEG